MRRANAAAEAIARTCYVARDDLPSFRKRFFAALRRAVPVDAAFFAAADPETLLFTFAAADEPLVAAGPLLLANEFADASDVNRFAALARARAPVATLDQATGGRRAESTRFRDILAPLRFGDELRVALRAAGSTWGFLCLHREGKSGFSSAESAILNRLASHAGEAIRRIASETISNAGPLEVPVGVVLVSGDGRAVAMTAGAASSLAELEDVSVRIGEPLPLPLLAVVRRLDAIERGAFGGPAASRSISRRGAIIEIHAARLMSGADPALTALTIAPASSEARAGIQLAAFPLTRAQRRVAALVLQGRSTLQIVAELRVSEYTVQDHLKAVFDKVGVASRRELVAALLR